MQIRAYVLIKVSDDFKHQAVAAIRNLENVESVSVVSGIYNVIAVAKAQDLDCIADLVVSKVLKTLGVTSVETCMTID